MSDGIKTELDSIFAKRNEAEAARANERALREQTEENFVLEFASVREATIRPVFEQFRAELIGRGYSADISTAPSSDAADWIMIQFKIGGFGAPPNFVVGTRRGDQKVLLTQSAPGVVDRPIGMLSLSELNAEMLEQKLLAWLSEAFK